jgi:arsenate reductase
MEGSAGSSTCRPNVPIEPMIADPMTRRRPLSRFSKQGSVPSGHLAAPWAGLQHGRCRAVWAERVMKPADRGRIYNVLFLCTGNSARSIMAEALVNHWGRGEFRGYSAGSFPTGRVNPLALELLALMKIPAQDARSKSWDEFGAAPVFDIVITVCDRAAGEICPVWPGQPVTAHWGVDDPVAVTGGDAEKLQAFRKAFLALEHRIRILVNLPLASLDRLRLKQLLDEAASRRPGS